MEILQAVLIGLAALILAPGYFFYFDVTPKVAVVLFGTALLLVWYALSKQTRIPRVFTILAASQLASLAVSTVLSTSPALSLTGANWRRFGLLTQAAVWLFAWTLAGHTAGRPDRVRVILRGVSLSALATAVYGIAQYIGWDPLLPAAGYHIGEGIWTIVRPPGSLGYVSYFATWLLFNVFLSTLLAHTEVSPAWRGIAYSSAAISLTAMLLTGTRAAVLGLVAGALVWLFRSGFRVRRSWLTAAALACLAFAGLYLSPAGQPLRSRMRWFIEDPFGGARPTLWRDSAAMFLHRPTAGYGPEVFTAEFPHFESPRLARAYPDFLYESPHNIFLDAAVSQGLPGLVILALLFGLALRRSTPALGAALTAGLVAQQFTVFTLPTALITFTVAALALSDSKPEAPRVIRWFAAAACLPFLWAAVYLMVSDHALALTQQALHRADERAAATHYAQYQRWRLPGSGGELWYSRASLNLAQTAANPLVRFQALLQAAGAGVQATRTSEDPANAWYSMATVYAAQNDAANTEKSLRAAIAASPYWFKPHWTLAQVLRLEGRLPEAEAQAALAVQCDGGKNPEVGQTLLEIHAQRKTR
ncbi:MAG TPA: O-antigen ligase family protein [Candidatus Sulfopaludibacter sp.]|jgi:O-antigen ligase|nr:O-antigen ligase family protein [Candidatus Sulfopaludibacter sp.]